MAVYFIRNNRTNSIKIGHSQDPPDRLSNLQVANEDDLALECTIEHGDVELEQKLHEMWDDQHIRGEWFESSPRLEKFIDDMRRCQNVLRAHGGPGKTTLDWISSWSSGDKGREKWLKLWLHVVSKNQ